MISHTRRIGRLAAGTGLVLVLALTHVHAQTRAPQPPKPTPAAGQATPERMLIEAKQLVYDNDKNTVEAVGDVQIFYQGRTLEADRVTYNRATKRVSAEGNARLTEANGQVITGSRFDLTDDFRDGFIETLRTENPDKSRFAAPRAERSGGDTVTFQTGTYTACEPCKDNPEKPPLWQVRSQRIIHNGEEKTIYFEGSTLELAGVPIAYVPYFWAPDSTVQRKTGFLAPTVYSSTQLGVGMGVPFFWNLAPNYDLTLTPTVLSRQGFLGVGEWRHRLVNGSYTIRAAGTFQSDPGAYAAAPLGAGDRRFRGSLETFGTFDINDKWRFGWDISGSTDRYFYRNYRIRTEGLTSTFFGEVTSSVYLNGDWQKQQPIVHPVIDYNKRMEGPGLLGGEITVDANITSLSREQSAYQTIPTAARNFANTNYLVNTPASYYEGCFVYNKSECLLRGVGGTASRASIGVSWRRQVIDPIGQAWTPFASVRADAFYTSLNAGSFNNSFQNAFGIEEGATTRIMPAIGMSYAYPFVLTSASGNHVLSPVAQIVVRPNETNIARTPNEDSQSLVFDDTTLFQWNRFSGYDRNEGGIRMSYGVNYAGTFNNGAYANAMFGQSYHLAGRNSFAAQDSTNTGANTGLETRQSDYVARVQLAPTPFGSITAKGRFDERMFTARALEITARANFEPAWASVTYARYEAQPERAQPFRREGLGINAGIKLGQFWSARGGVLYDLDKYLTDRALTVPKLDTPRFTLAAASVGTRYEDECTTFDVSYVTSFRDTSQGTLARTNQGVLFRLELRTLGGVGFRQSLDAVYGGVADGIKN
ncbi:MAG: LPS-assembly protein LptD [Hyphomicrobiales bacterium]|nr:LPS-assembly protein LptD [Hyphomicrobiales bacterium]